LLQLSPLLLALHIVVLLLQIMLRLVSHFALLLSLLILAMQMSRRQRGAFAIRRIRVVGVLASQLQMVILRGARVVGVVVERRNVLVAGVADLALIMVAVRLSIATSISFD
jgi:hypothetical protein